MIIQQHPLFEKLTDEEFEKFIQIFEEKKIQANTTLSTEGELKDSAFILIFGEVSVFKDTVYENDYIVTQIKAGGDEFFGEVTLIDGKERISTIKASKESIILEIDRNVLIDFLDNNPIIGYKVMKYLAFQTASHLRKADKDMATLFNALVEVVEND
jgi:CRP/FNR family cyclic AMP-dependent transcriptional regulator